MDSTVPVAELMSRFRQGDRTAAKRLVDLFYPELHRLAVSKMKGERTEHTWQPTVLVNELFIELTKIKSLKPGSEDNNQEKAAFIGLAGFLMKRLLIHHSRPLYRHAEKVELDEGDFEFDCGVDQMDAMHDVERALAGLGGIDAKLRAVVEMKVFEGLTAEEIAGKLGTTAAAVNRQWAFAKRWLASELDKAAGEAAG